MHKVLHSFSDKELAHMSEAGKKRVRAEFSERKMAERLDVEIEKMMQVEGRGRNGVLQLGLFVISLGVLGSVTVGLGKMAMKDTA